MDTNEYDEQNLFVVNFSWNIYDITGEQDDNSDNDDNFEEIRNEENFGGNRGRGRGQRRGQGWVNLPNDFLSPSPYLIFSLFFSLAQIEIIVKNTNKYAYVKDAGEGRQWKELTIKEFRIWLAILIYAGVFKLPSIRDYWNRDNKFPEHKISTFMSLIRFEQIKRFIHISDCTAPLPFWYSKVNPLATHIQTVSKSICVPSSNISVDEMIVRFSGRSIHTVRIKNKPTPEGYKILSLCDAGYTYSFIFTSRVQNQPEVQQVTELSKVGNEVYHLASQLPIENKSFNIYMDNYFSSIKLFKYLHEKKIGACGTVRKNSANFPQILKVDKKLDWDTLSGMVVDNVLAILWMDNGPVTMLSTVHQIDNGNENQIERIRRRPRETSTNAVKVRAVFGTASKKSLPIPVVIDDYNHFMSGVDIADQLRGYYGTQLPVRRTWMPLFFWLLDTALINSYLILKKINANVNHQKDFRMQLA
ncbi:piggyBac transposable element-derived protein 4-like [Rhizophagus clarus]|uniref:PiggyBac transposable element-derived protein 4-like n=1 Tax=Rhizophagus clarus TaxID=94130 RepID=A0A8H3LZV9_9GLOM|nr:piggyBac transposable element-derived protein 4-like [Rhizophagus clarus]